MPRHAICQEPVMLSPADFIDDFPWVEEVPFLQEIWIDNQIEGVRLNRLVTHKDKRGDLTVLISDLKGVIAPIPHVYNVMRLPVLFEPGFTTSDSRIGWPTRTETCELSSMILEPRARRTAT